MTQAIGPPSDHVAATTGTKPPEPDPSPGSDPSRRPSQPTGTMSSQTTQQDRRNDIPSVESQRLEQFFADQGYRQLSCINFIDKKGPFYELDMSFSTVTTIAPSIGKLQYLTEFVLFDNPHVETLPEQIGDLNLQSLRISTCKGITRIPTSIGKLEDLKILQLERLGDRVRLPQAIWSLKSLEKLDLNCWMGSLTSLPKEIGDLRNLQELKLSRSFISSLPPSIGQLTNLKILDLKVTDKLSTLPDEIGNLQNLRELDLSRSALRSLPSSIGRLKSLQDLDLNETTNLLRLPKEIGDLVKLEELDLSRSAIRYLPSSIGRLQSLQDLDLNEMTNLLRLPKEIENLSNLTIHLLNVNFYLAKSDIEVSKSDRNETPAPKNQDGRLETLNSGSTTTRDQDKPSGDDTTETETKDRSAFGAPCTTIDETSKTPTKNRRRRRGRRRTRGRGKQASTRSASAAEFSTVEETTKALPSVMPMRITTSATRKTREMKGKGDASSPTPTTRTPNGKNDSVASRTRASIRSTKAKVDYISQIDPISMTVQQLRAILREKGISCPSKAKKQVLVDLYEESIIQEEE